MVLTAVWVGVSFGAGDAVLAVQAVEPALTEPRTLALTASDEDGHAAVRSRGMGSSIGRDAGVAVPAGV